MQISCNTWLEHNNPTMLEQAMIARIRFASRERDESSIDEPQAALECRLRDPLFLGVLYDARSTYVQHTVACTSPLVDSVCRLCTRARSITLFRTSSGEREVSMATDGSVSAVVFHPFAAVVAVGDRSGNVSTWCSRSGTRLRTTLNLFPVSALIMSPVTAMLAIGTEDGGVIVKDAHSERQVTRLIVPGRAHRVDSLSFSSCFKMACLLALARSSIASSTSLLH
jgi:WD40 repeat protein